MSEQEKTVGILNQVSGTNGLKALLKDDGVTTRMAGSSEALDSVLQQLQRDVSANKDLPAKEGWAIIKAIRMVQDYSLLFAAQGDAVLKADTIKANARKVEIHQP